MTHNITWGSYGKHNGPIFRGENLYSPPEPYTPWQKILGVIADCEGKLDTVVMHDGTGITAGFMQWTLTSGRLQKLFDYFNTVTYPGMFPGPDGYITLHDVACKDLSGVGRFVPFGFDFVNDKMVELSTGDILHPAKDKAKIVGLCRGKTKEHAIGVMNAAIACIQVWGVAEAQIEFAEQELKAELGYTRAVLGEHKNINQLLSNTWDTPAPALFYNLYQNNPRVTFNLFIEARKTPKKPLFDAAWNLLRKSTFGNWSYNSKDYKTYKRTPRIVRIKRSIDKYYQTSLVI